MYKKNVHSVPNVMGYIIKLSAKSASSVLNQKLRIEAKKMNNCVFKLSPKSITIRK